MSAHPLLPLRREFLGRLSAVRAVAYPLFRGVFSRSALSGPPTEFDGHRPYLPGDDTRWIDWNLFARLEELYVKVFQVEEEVEVLLMVDISPSMTVSVGTKYHVASAAAAALSYLALLTSHPLTVVQYAEKALASTGPHRHLGENHEIMKFLASPSVNSTGTDLEKSLAPLLLRRRRPLTVIVLSDGFQREPIEKVASIYRNSGGRKFMLFRIHCQADLTPPLRGNLVVRDAESNDSRAILSDRLLEKQLHGRIASYFHNLEKNLLKNEVESHLLRIEKPFEGEFLDVLLSSMPSEARVPTP